MSTEILAYKSGYCNIMLGHYTTVGFDTWCLISLYICWAKSVKLC